MRVFFAGKKLIHKGILILLLIALYLLFARTALVNTWQEEGSSEIKVRINFLFPMRQLDLGDDITITPEVPWSEPDVTSTWLDNTTLLLSIREKQLPRGQKISFSLRAPTVLPLINKHVSGHAQARVVPRLISPENGERVPTRGPIRFSFNTMVSAENLKGFFESELKGTLRPAEIIAGGKKIYDYSCWLFLPERPLEPGKEYNFTIEKGLAGKSGAKISDEKRVRIVGAVPPEVVSTSPEKGKKGVELYREITVRFDREIKGGEIKLTDPKGRITVPGRTVVDDKRLTFTPDMCFLPDSTYRVWARGYSPEGEPSSGYDFSFRTISMGDKMWVDVRLGKIHTVTVYRGREPIRHMIASGGRPDSKTPLGIFYTKDRGSSFWSQRFGEGATYWVRLIDQILVHSVPKDANWKTKEEEHRKLGLPASHGCIRLDEKDAKWFYENIPSGTKVYIHR